MSLSGYPALKLFGIASLAAVLFLPAVASAAETVTSPGGNVFKVLEPEAEAEAEAPAPAEENAVESQPEPVSEPEPAENAIPAPAAAEETTLAEPTTGAVSNSESQTSSSTGPGRIQLSAVIAAGAPPMDDNIAYKIERLEYGSPKEVIASHTGPDAEVNVPNGRYRVTATYGEVVAQDDIQVNGEVQHQVNLNAGWINLRMIPYVGGDAISNPIDWQVLTFAKNYKGERDVLRDVRGVPSTTVVLPAGWYMVHAVESGELTKHAIEVTPGATIKYTLVRQ